MAPPMMVLIIVEVEEQDVAVAVVMVVVEDISFVIQRIILTIAGLMVCVCILDLSVPLHAMVTKSQQLQPTVWEAAIATWTYDSVGVKIV